MNTSDNQPGDKRLESALKRGITHTSASLERRFEVMRLRLSRDSQETTKPLRSRQKLRYWNQSVRVWSALAASLALIVGLWHFNTEHQDVSPHDFHILEGSKILQNEDLLTLNQSLEPTLELFDDELLEFLIAVSYENIY
ncbi:MAG: hypothetical protein JJU20_14475 [Opitutales bacterium]|nr:hypothetical protein [Opitutales bacterium]